MKALNRAIDRFCQKHRRFGIPRLMMIVVIATAIVYIIGQPEMLSIMMFQPVLILRGEIWRLVTWVFIPWVGGSGFSGVFFMAIALYLYYFIGSTLEREWGTAKFTIYYIFGILSHIIYGFVIYFAFNTVILIIPTYINLSMFFAFAVLFPDVVFRLFFIIPVKVKWLALANAAFFVYGIISSFIVLRYPSNLTNALLPIVAVLNFLFICGNDLLVILRPIKYKTSSQIIDFKKAAKKAKRDLADKPYRYKCAVCGKTDTDHPALDFRYCSKCEGYHCFCIEHINQHIHIRD